MGQPILAAEVLGATLFRGSIRDSSELLLRMIIGRLASANHLSFAAAS